MRFRRSSVYYDAGRPSWGFPDTTWGPEGIQVAVEIERGVMRLFARVLFASRICLKVVAREKFARRSSSTQFLRICSRDAGRASLVLRFDVGVLRACSTFASLSCYPFGIAKITATAYAARRGFIAPPP